ncbi:MAG: hypothetical protein Q9214_001323 [Letrouitia sp. 1 TL-2023]
MPQNLTTGRLLDKKNDRKTQNAAKLLEACDSTALYDTKSVRDQVQQWQAQGGGVVIIEDVLGGGDVKIDHDAGHEDEPLQRIQRNPPVNATKAVDGSPQASPRSYSSQKRKGTDKNNSHTRSESTPPRRVVSDGHWRKDRTPPVTPSSRKTNEDVNQKESNTRVKRSGTRAGLLADDEIKNNIQKVRRPIDTNSNQERDVGIHSDQTKARRRSRSHRKSEGNKGESGDTIGRQLVIDAVTCGEDLLDESPTLKKKIAPRPRSPGLKEDIESAQYDLKNQHASFQSDLKYGRRRLSSQQKPSEPNRHAQSVQSSLPGIVADTSHRGKIIGHALGHSKRTSTKSLPTLSPTPRAPSIEAWLDETLDPFLDSKSPPTEHLDTQNGHENTEDSSGTLVALEPEEDARLDLQASKIRKRIPSSLTCKNGSAPSDDKSSPHSMSLKAETAFGSESAQLNYRPRAGSSPLKRCGARKLAASLPQDGRNLAAVKQPDPPNDGCSILSSNDSTSSVEGPDPSTPMRPPCISRRRFPSTGKHRLSTIASVDTFDPQMQTEPALSESKAFEQSANLASFNASEQEPKKPVDPCSIRKTRSRLTKHDDLISVLSMPKTGDRSIRSARSIRTNRSRLATATVEDLLKELSIDEEKYMRELRTLVDGVIPVLLTCVLSKSDSAIAAGLFRSQPTNPEDQTFTKPIMDMGVALERLKSLHRQIPTENTKALLRWAQRAQRVYTEYLKAWRMGFQDVVVNLAPALDADGVPTDTKSKVNGGPNDGLPIDQNGDVVNNDGARVDVAFLLKRPLVRLKNLAKTLKGINFLSPSAEAENLACKFQELVVTARDRSNEERARLEDEAATSIDPTRARDPQTLAPLTGVIIESTRRVRARDHFNLVLQHSSGQRIDCRAELLLRDEAGGPGDLLICEVDATDRWLLFPPIGFNQVSARNGDGSGEIVIMIRGVSAKGSEWQEILSLTIADEQTGFEWVQMLGLIPVPPTISRSPSFLNNHSIRMPPAQRLSANLKTREAPVCPNIGRPPGPPEIDVPIGEQAIDTSKEWTKNFEDLALKESTTESSLRENASLSQGLSNLKAKGSSVSPHLSAKKDHDLCSLPPKAPEKSMSEQGPTYRPRNFKEALGLTGTSSVSLGIKRRAAKRISKTYGSPTVSRSINSPNTTRRDDSQLTEKAQIRRTSGINVTENNENEPSHLDPAANSTTPDPDPRLNPRLFSSSVPSTEHSEASKTPVCTSPCSNSSEMRSSLRHPGLNVSKPAPQDSPVSHPTRHSTTPIDVQGITSPVLSSKANHLQHRRSSSPLKHEYEPSTASETSSDSDDSILERNAATPISSSSEDEDFEEDAASTLLPLVSLGVTPKSYSQQSLYSLPNDTLKPSESASQAPYKSVPTQPKKASKTIASIFSWSDQGSWESLHPDECSIVITPGLIEAFEMSAAHSRGIPLSSSTPVVDLDSFSEASSFTVSQADETSNVRPLVALELTPLVPLRRGTAIDISIRSPPIANSQITTGNNIMFRSRNPEECEALYALINHSRINNPTYIALQNARGPFGSVENMGQRASTRAAGSRVGSWFRGWGGSSGYRARNTPTPSIAPSESSVGTMVSAFSALKRFGKSGGMFNIARSTISSRENSIYTSSDNSSGSGASSLLNAAVAGEINAPIGLNNAKIRLYIRETPSRWRDMGAARLTILRPGQDAVTGTSASGEAVKRPSTARQRLSEKRIVINGKTRGEVLLDVTLGESCFERVARTGIALSVWEDVVGPNGELGTVGAVGGVGGGRVKVYMIQMKTLPLVRASWCRQWWWWYQRALLWGGNFYPHPGFITGTDDIFFDYHLVLGEWPRNPSLSPLIRELARLLLNGCIFMTRPDDLVCAHEPFGDAFYFGPERLSARYENDDEARVNSGFSQLTYQTVVENLDKEGSEGKRLFIKDMAQCLVPLDGKEASIAPSLSKVKRGIGTSENIITNTSEGPYPEPHNPTVIPKAILEKFHFTFLIRHPRLSIPSYYRCTVPPLDRVTGFYNFMPAEAGYNELRRVFDYLRLTGQIGPAVAGRKTNATAVDSLAGKIDICVVDADDLLDHPSAVVRAYCENVGVVYDPNMLDWSTEDEHEQAKVAFEKWPGFHDDVVNSTGLKPRAYNQGKSDTEQYNEWAEKYGEEGAQVIQRTVDANIEDYEYMKQFALKV